MRTLIIVASLKIFTISLVKDQTCQLTVTGS
ncbi:hypothetical protein RDI58_013274 [Solanum bulbocastanum]|uniref:Uncharacterized protein n=2 Tax=Solanum TaxID=4107 RepID=A0AAN8YDV0_SOLBU